MGKFKIVWSEQAKYTLKVIYDYYKEKSQQGASNLLSDILQSPKTLRFAEQYQVDEINSRYRRIVVRDYKVLYTEEEGVVRIVDIVSAKQSPEELQKK